MVVNLIIPQCTTCTVASCGFTVTLLQPVVPTTQCRSGESLGLCQALTNSPHTRRHSRCAWTLRPLQPMPIANCCSFWNLHYFPACALFAKLKLTIWWYDKGELLSWEREWPSSCEEQWSAESISDSCSSSASGFLQILSKRWKYQLFLSPNLKQSSVIPGLKLLSFKDSVFSKVLVIVQIIILQCTCSTCWESRKWQGDWTIFEQSVSQCLWGWRHDRLSHIFLRSNFNIYLYKNKNKTRTIAKQ